MQLPPEIPEADEPDAKEEEAPGGETVADGDARSEDEKALGEVLTVLRGQTGHDFTHYTGDAAAANGAADAGQFHGESPGLSEIFPHPSRGGAEPCSRICSSA